MNLIVTFRLSAKAPKRGSIVTTGHFELGIEAIP
jgi:hypothetical protein